MYELVEVFVCRHIVYAFIDLLAGVLSETSMSYEETKAEHLYVVLFMLRSIYLSIYLKALIY